MTKHLIIPDSHAHPDFHNERADLVGHLINDEQPDVVINMGDLFDMPSLATYDRGKRSFAGRSYAKDIESGVEFQDRMWSIVKARKRKMPRRVSLIGNHEYRIDRVLDLSPELEGTVSYKDMQLDRYWDEVVPYVGQTPGTIEIDGVYYAHFFVSGVMGRPISGIHPGYSLITKQLRSTTCGHVHTFDHCVRSATDGKKINGLCCGVFQDYDSPWAGEVNNEWCRGVVIKHNVNEGQYDLEWVSMDRLKKEYS